MINQTPDVDPLSVITRPALLMRWDALLLSLLWRGVLSVLQLRGRLGLELCLLLVPDWRQLVPRWLRWTGRPGQLTPWDVRRWARGIVRSTRRRRIRRGKPRAVARHGLAGRHRLSREV